MNKKPFNDEMFTANFDLVFLIARHLLGKVEAVEVREATAKARALMVRDEVVLEPNQLFLLPYKFSDEQIAKIVNLSGCPEWQVISVFAAITKVFANKEGV